MERELIFSARRKDFRVDTFHAGGKGGQHQNATDSGVRITHIDTGISAESRSERSQHHNKKIAFRKLTARLYAYVMAKDNESCHKRQDERIRTYHAVRGTVKDHRTGLVRSYKKTLDGDLDEFIEAAGIQLSELP